MNRLQQLKDLETTLSQLVSILKLDPKCSWLPHFEASLSTVRNLVIYGCNQSDINQAAGSLMYVYGGMGSFNDYWPGQYDSATNKYTPIPGTEQFDALSSRAYDQAVALRAAL